MVADQIRLAIAKGILKPGDRLPGETELARLVNVSRGTVREALQQLVSQELIVTTRGVKGGSVVATPTSAHIQRLLGTNLKLLAGSDVATVEWMYEAREMIEVRAAGLAAVRHHAGDLEAITAATTQTTRGGPGDADHHHKFHLAVVQATGNSMLEIMLRPLFTVLDAKLEERPLTDEFVQGIERDHQRIARAIESRDREEAERAMAEHLAMLRAYYAVMWELP